MDICASSYKLNSNQSHQILLRLPRTIHIPGHAAPRTLLPAGEQKNTASTPSSSGVATFCLGVAQLDELPNFQIRQCFQQLDHKASRGFNPIVGRNQYDNGNGQFFVLLVRQVLIKGDQDLETVIQHCLHQLAV